MSKKFAIFTFGCKVNQADSAGIRKLLLDKGFVEADQAALADCMIINSCAVTAESVRKVRQTMRSLRKRCPEAVIVLTGCWPQAYPKDTFDEADYVVGTKEREQIAALLQTHFRSLCEEIHHSAALPLAADSPCNAVVPYFPKGGELFSSLAGVDAQHTRAFLKIQEGCNQFCTYCIIPYARGRCRSMPLERVIAEAKSLAAQDFQEIVLTGINLGFYGIDTGDSLADAVEACAAPEGIRRVRFGSLEPERITPELLHRLAACEKFCPQFHLSLQSGANSVLQRMNRHYSPATYCHIVDQIRTLFSESAITTDVIVGFPGETDEDFAETLHIVQKIGFAKVHIFPYSPREGTPAASMPDQISGNVKNQRTDKLAALAAVCTQKHLAHYIGRSVSVLVEDCKRCTECKDRVWDQALESVPLVYQNAHSYYRGHMPDGTLVKIFPEKIEKRLHNSIICVTIEGYEDDCCIARIQ